MQTTYPTSVYTVPSDSTPGLTYTVAAICACGQQISGLWHCSCPDHVHRARDCKHVTRVVAGLTPAHLLARHLAGDWGDLCAADARANDAALAHGGRLLSAYATAAGRVW